MSKFLFLLTFCFFLQSTIHAQSETEKLEQILFTYHNHEGYDKIKHPLGIHTRAYHQQEAEFADSILHLVQKINVDELNESDQISVSLLEFVLHDKMNYFKFERFLNPILSDAGFHASLPYRVRPLTNYKQTIDYLNLLKSIPIYIDQHLKNIREGLDRGMSQPLVIFKGYESSYDTHIVTNYRDSYFYSPFESLPSGISDQQRDSILMAAQNIIETDVTPQFIRVKSFFETEYFPKTRTTLGVSETPGGSDLYQDRINFYTTSQSYSAADIHEIGLKEVARIRAKMEAIISELEFKGDFDSFLKFLRSD